MKNVSRITALVVAVLMLCQFIPLAQADEANYVTFHIKLHRNIVFSKYSVQVYLDGRLIGTMKQGDQMTFGAYLSGGQHQLRFEGDKEGVSVRTWTLGTLQDNTVVSCELQTHRKRIDLESTNIALPTGAVIQPTETPGILDHEIVQGVVIEIIRSMIY